MATTQENRTFTNEIINTDEIDTDNFLNKVVAWISSTLNPEDVFSKTDLECWVLENGFKEETSNDGG